jgi:hypothetical protein
VQVGERFVDFFVEDSDLIDFGRIQTRLQELAATVGSA